MENVENTDNKKLIGILSYIGILWIVAYIMYRNKKNEYNTFHLREGLGLLIIEGGIFILTKILTFLHLYFMVWIVHNIAYPVMLILSIIGIINVVNEKMKPIPFVSEYLTQEYLKDFE